MQILKIISRLMDYPAAEIQDNLSELKLLITKTREISPAMRQQLLHLLDSIYGQVLIDAQEQYTGLFDRGRALSLLLFEHVHGESRDRGQAMVDLMALYERNGFAINVRQLPDYIPMYLEYLAQRPDLEARQGLVDIAHILGVLSARLQERKNPYSALFDALIMISGVPIDVSDLRQKVSQEENEDTPEAVDKIWQEEAVTFGAGDAHNSRCSSQQTLSEKISPHQSSTPSTPLHWVGEKKTAKPLY